MKRSAGKKLTLSWHIGLPHWETDELFERLLALLQEYKSVLADGGTTALMHFGEDFKQPMTSQFGQGYVPGI